MLKKDCRDYIMFDDENIKAYLADDKQNFVLVLNDQNIECQNLVNLKTQHKYRSRRGGEEKHKIWYECLLANNTFGPYNVKRQNKFVKMGSDNKVVKKPSWYPNGNPSGSRVYELVKDKKVKALVSSNILDGDSLISGDHCNHRVPVQTYKLKEIN